MQNWFVHLITSDINTNASLQIDPKAITQPWINYPLYIAARTFRKSSFLQPALLTFLAVSQIAPGQSRQPADSTAGEVHITKTARANFQRIIGVFDGLQPYWNGVRYIRSVLLQKAEGVSQVSLIDGGDDIMSPDTLPPELAAILAGMGNDRRSDGMSLPVLHLMDTLPDTDCSARDGFDGNYEFTYGQSVQLGPWYRNCGARDEFEE